MKKILFFLSQIFLESHEEKEDLIPFLPRNETSHYKKELPECFFDGVYIATNYRDISAHLERYKYYSDRQYVSIFGDLLSKLYRKYSEEFPENPSIQPIPMHWSRYFIRGFHHTRIIAEYVAKNISLSIISQIKAKYTHRQSHLSREKRMTNRKNSYVFKGKNVLPKNIILIDDVVSTGSTINECARFLKQNGVEKVYVLCLASNRS